MKLDMKLEINDDIASGIAVAVMKDWYEYLLKERIWFETDEEDRQALEDDWGHSMYVHPQDYSDNIKYIKALELLIPAFGGEV